MTTRPVPLQIELPDYDGCEAYRILRHNRRLLYLYTILVVINLVLNLDAPLIVLAQLVVFGAIWGQVFQGQRFKLKDISGSYRHYQLCRKIREEKARPYREYRFPALGCEPLLITEEICHFPAGFTRGAPRLYFIGRHTAGYKLFVQLSEEIVGGIPLKADELHIFPEVGLERPEVCFPRLSYDEDGEIAPGSYAILFVPAEEDEGDGAPKRRGSA